MKCELIHCQSKGSAATVKIYASENIGDESYSVGICSNCAKALGMKKGFDLPEPQIVIEKLAKFYGEAQ